MKQFIFNRGGYIGLFLICLFSFSLFSLVGCSAANVADIHGGFESTTKTSNIITTVKHSHKGMANVFVGNELLLAPTSHIVNDTSFGTHDYEESDIGAFIVSVYSMAGDYFNGDLDAEELEQGIRDSAIDYLMGSSVFIKITRDRVFVTGMGFNITYDREDWVSS